MQIEIDAAGKRHATPGDSSAHVAGDRLDMPKDIAIALRADGIRTAEELLSYMAAFPTSLAYILHWSLSDVQRATYPLKNELRGHIPDEQLNFERGPERVFGARNPEEL